MKLLDLQVRMPEIENIAIHKCSQGGTGMEPLLLTVEQAADLLQISRSHLYKLILRGEIPSLKIGRSRRLRRIDLGEWANTRTATEEPSGTP